MCFLWLCLLIRAGQLQIFSPDRLAELKKRQFHSVVNLQSRRGDILDRNGRPLAFSVSSYSLYADPSMLRTTKTEFRKVAAILGVPYETLRTKVKERGRRFVWLARFLPEDTMEKLRELKIHGFGFVDEWKRVYPNDNLFGHSLGFLGSEGQGLEGLELTYEDWLQGNHMKVQVKKDARGRPLMSEGLLFTENPDGKDLHLTIDSEFQFGLETELRKAVEEFAADGAMGIVLDAKSAEIRAMAAYPSFDPNFPNKSAFQFRRNRVLTDPFEPGSVMKPFVVASALERKLITPDKHIFGENGNFKVNDRIVREAESHHSFGWMSLTELIAQSSNVGAAKVAMMVGPEKLREDLMKFGFGEKVGVELNGESRGILAPLPWIDHLLANVGFGHGISVTPLQMAAAYNMLANGGVWKKPTLMKAGQQRLETEIAEELNQGASATLPREPSEINPNHERRVLSLETTKLVNEMLRKATQDKGTGKLAQVPPFEVAGKTGTAQKVMPGSRGYAKGAYTASFAGFFPVDAPRFVIYVVVDHPVKAYYGGEVAAPLFARIAKSLVVNEGLVPTRLSMVGKKSQPSSPTAEGESNAKSPKEKTTHLQTSIENEFVPDWQNLTLREVLREARSAQIELKVLGQGVVAETIPSAFEPLPGQKKVTVILKEVR